METISNVAAAASKAIWGEQTATQQNETAGQEPISGQQGKGTANEPFDQGNTDLSTQKSESASQEPISGHLAKTPTAEPFGQGYSDTLTSPSAHGTDTSKSDTGLTSHSTRDKDTSKSDTAFDSSSTRDTETSKSKTALPASFYTGEGVDSSAKMSGPDSILPTATTSDTRVAPSSTMSGTTHTPTNTDRDTSESNTALPSATHTDRDHDEHSNPLAGTAQTTRTPNNPINAASGGEIDPYKNTDKTGVVGGRTGDAPKAEVVAPTSRSTNPGAAPESGAAPFAKQQGADKPTDAPEGDQKAAVIKKKDDAEEILKKRDPNDHSGEPMHMHDGSELKSPSTQEERRTSKAGNPGGQEHGKDPKGTGEQWVKTSGMAADGGDFDATKPGAAREADRLMEEKGITKSTSDSPAEQSTTTSAHHGTEKEKVSVAEKLKNKLHIGHKNK